MAHQMTLAELLALPVSVDIETAGRAFKMGRTKSHELAKTGRFPCRVVTVGPKYVVPRSALFDALGIESPAVEPSADDRTAAVG